MRREKHTLLDAYEHMTQTCKVCRANVQAELAASSANVLSFPHIVSHPRAMHADVCAPNVQLNHVAWGQARTRETQLDTHKMLSPFTYASTSNAKASAKPPQPCAAARRAGAPLKQRPPRRLAPPEPQPQPFAVDFTPCAERTHVWELARARRRLLESDQWAQLDALAARQDRAAVEERRQLRRAAQGVWGLCGCSGTSTSYSSTDVYYAPSSALFM